MEIDFIISSLQIGGAERVLVTLANLFAEKGLIVRVLTFLPQKEFNLNSKVDYINLNASSFKNQTLRYSIELFKFYKGISNRPQLAISFMTQTSLSAILACKFYGIKIIASEHTNHLRTSTNPFLVKFTRKYVYRLADALTVLTMFDLPYYQKVNKNVVVMPNPNPFKDHASNAKREKTILAVGNLDKYKVKGFDNLLSLTKNLLEKHTDWRLVIAGGGNHGLVKLKELVNKNKMENQVEFLGHCSNMSEIMGCSSIFVLSSRMEGLPMALIEAMSLGMACIAFDCISGPSDIIINGENGLLIENQNLQSMQHALERLMNEEDSRNYLGNNALKIKERYDPENIYKKWVELIAI